MSFLPDFGIFTMGMWSVGLGAVGAAVTGIVLANTDLFLSKPEKATLEFLEAIELKTLGSGKILGVWAVILWYVVWGKNIHVTKAGNA